MIHLFFVFYKVKLTCKFRGEIKYHKHHISYIVCVLLILQITAIQFHFRALRHSKLNTKLFMLNSNQRLFNFGGFEVIPFSFIFYAPILCWPVKTCFSKRTTNLSEKFKNVNKIWTEIKRHQTSWRNFCLQKDPKKKLNSEHKKINHGILCYWCCWHHRLVFMKMHGKVFSHFSHKMTY